MHEMMSNSKYIQSMDIYIFKYMLTMYFGVFVVIPFEYFVIFFVRCIYKI